MGHRASKYSDNAPEIEHKTNRALVKHIREFVALVSRNDAGGYGLLADETQQIVDEIEKRFVRNSSFK